MRKIFFAVLMCGLLMLSCGAAATDDVWITIDPIPFITTDTGNVTISGTTTLPAGRALLVEIVNTDGCPDGTSNLFGRSMVTIVQNGTDAVRTWNISINATADLPPKEYSIVVSGIADDVQVRDSFMTHYPARYTTPEPTKASGFSIIPVLFVTAAAVMFMRK